MQGQVARPVCIEPQRLQHKAEGKALPNGLAVRIKPSEGRGLGEGQRKAFRLPSQCQIVLYRRWPSAGEEACSNAHSFFEKHRSGCVNAERFGRGMP